jgi:hypothetical protein
VGKVLTKTREGLSRGRAEGEIDEGSEPQRFPEAWGRWLIGAMLLGAAGCNSSNGKVVKFFTGTRETAALERAATELQVYSFEEQHPNI